ncbi:MAG: hypothetical protein D8M59_14085 [Planctomycetes bacterium]|nr:hypothetical protein [Planctomycetota bacterium]
MADHDLSQPVDLKELGEPALPPDESDRFTDGDREMLEGNPTQRLGKAWLRQLKEAHRERDDWKRRHDQLQEKAIAFERLDDRRRGAWINALLGGLGGAAAGVIAICDGSDTVRIVCGTLGVTAAVLGVIFAVYQGKQARP